MSGYVVEVHMEHYEDSTQDSSELYGPFRSQAAAIEFSGKVGRASGLNLNTWGNWYGTDGGEQFAHVWVRVIQHPVQARKVGQRIRAWFHLTGKKKEHE